MGFTGCVAGCVGGCVARGVALFPTKNWEQKSEGDLIWSKKGPREFEQQEIEQLGT